MGGSATPAKVSKARISEHCKLTRQKTRGNILLHFANREDGGWQVVNLHQFAGKRSRISCPPFQHRQVCVCYTESCSGLLLRPPTVQSGCFESLVVHTFL